MVVGRVTSVVLNQGLPVALSLRTLGSDVALRGRVRVVQRVVGTAVHAHRRRRRKCFVVIFSTDWLGQRSTTHIHHDVVVVVPLVDDCAGVAGNVGEALQTKTFIKKGILRYEKNTKGLDLLHHVICLSLMLLRDNCLLLLMLLVVGHYHSRQWFSTNRWKMRGCHHCCLLTSKMIRDLKKC